MLIKEERVGFSLKETHWMKRGMEKVGGRRRVLHIQMELNLEYLRVCLRKWPDLKLTYGGKITALKYNCCVETTPIIVYSVLLFYFMVFLATHAW